MTIGTVVVVVAAVVVVVLALEAFAPRAQRRRLLADIREDLAEFGVLFDHWTSERAVADSGAIMIGYRQLRDAMRAG